MREKFYNYIMELAGTLPAHKINHVWQTIGACVEQGRYDMPFKALAEISGLTESSVMEVLMHCHFGGYLEIWSLIVCKDCNQGFGNVILGEMRNYVLEGHCSYCGGFLIDPGINFIYRGESYEWRTLPMTPIKNSQFLPGIPKEFKGVGE